MGEATQNASAVSDEYLAAMRGYLRISNTAFDSEITDLVSAARDDLVLGGVIPPRAQDESDMLIKRAIGTYVKAEFGLDNEDAEKYKAAYNELKNRRLVSDKYITEGG